MFVRCLPRWMMQSISRQLQTSAVRRSNDIFHVQDELDFQKQILDSGKPVLVSFHASWCGPCRSLEPRLEKIITNYNKNVQTSAGDQHIALARVDVDKFSELSSRYNINAVPTGEEMVAIKNGKELSRFTGLIDEDRIETVLDQLNR